MTGDAGDDLWEANAGWWQAGFTEGADPEYVEQILPLAADALAGARSVLDVGTGEGQVARLAMARGAERVVGIDPTAAQIIEAAEVLDRRDQRTERPRQPQQDGPGHEPPRTVDAEAPRTGSEG